MTHLFVSSAWAQDAQPQQADMGTVIMSTLQNSWFIIAIFLVFYFLVFKPQIEKTAAQQRMHKALQPGDQVVTNSGIYGKVVKFDGDHDVVLEIANGVQVKIVKAFITNRIAAGK